MLTIVRNRTWAFDLTIFDTYVKDGDPGNVPTNHTGWTIRSQIRTRVGNKLVANLNVTFPVPTAGTVAIRHEREFTRSLVTGDYWWDVVATDPAGDDHVYVEPEPIAVRDNPTDPANATYDFVPGGGGAVMHTHVISDVTGLQAALNGKAPLVHTHSIANVTGLQAVLDGKAPLAHTHVIADVLGLQTILNDLSEGGGGSTTYAGLTDAATVDLPTVNTPLASALSGKQPLDADLTSWAGVTRASGFDTFTGTPSSANLRALVTDETGTGALVFGTGPTFAGLTNTGALNLATGTTFTYGTGIAALHLFALGATTTGLGVFTAVDPGAARTTLGLGSLATINSPLPVANGGTGTTNGSITGTGALTLASAAASNINLTPGTTGFVDIIKPASSGVRESILRAKVSDAGDDAFQIYNGTISNDRFSPAFGGAAFSNPGTFGIIFNAVTNASNDSGTAPLMLFSSGRTSSTSDPFNGTYTDIATRPLFRWQTGANTNIAEISAAKNLSIFTTTASTSTTTGALIVSGGVGIAGNINAGGTLAVTGASTLTGGATFGGATQQAATRIALGAGTTGAELFGAATAAAANAILANNIVAKSADFTLAQTDAGTYMRLTKTGSTQTITLPATGISAGAEFQFYRITTEALAFSGGTVNGAANLASVPTNGAFALKHIASGTYDFI